MKKTFYVPLLLVIIAVIAFFGYKYREQSLADLVRINDVEKFYIVIRDEGPESFELIKADDETINQLRKFLDQYRVKLTAMHGYSSQHPNEKFTLYFQYKDGDSRLYEFEHDLVIWTSIYKVLNPPVDYKEIENLEKRLISD